MTIQTCGAIYTFRPIVGANRGIHWMTTTNPAWPGRLRVYQPEFPAVGVPMAMRITGGQHRGKHIITSDVVRVTL
jgi:hypothetical protein